MSQWIWVARSVVLALHDEQLAEHGGGSGLRDEGLLDSALARPLNLEAYGDPDAADLAAAYAFGVAKNHPFVDGNKRTAAVAMELFLDQNGYELTATDEALVLTILALADGSSSETDLADWVRGNMRKV
ncbi:MAG: type II toxin-antitoxin system death-on-curing family toxin [Alphaproteobacteria bacterium]|nr:type II toxin-antitoxin system death-on-curing family toxin [Alphaproteobacteria bacterium]